MALSGIIGAGVVPFAIGAAAYAGPVIEDSLESSSGGGTTGSLGVESTGGVGANDLLFIVVGSDHNGDVVQFSTIESGWSKHNEEGTATYDAHIGSFYAVPGSREEGQVSIAFANSNEGSALYMRISGAHATSPIDVTATGGGSSGTSHTISEVTTTQDNCLAFAVLGFDGGDGDPFTTTSDGWSKLADITSGTGGQDFSGAIFTKEMASAGATGDCVVTSSVSDGAQHYQFAIAPA